MTLFFSKDYNLWVRFTVPYFGELKFNPIVTLLSLAMIWSMVISCIVKKEAIPFERWRSTLTDLFTWLYVGSFNLFGIFALVIYFRYVFFYQTYKYFLSQLQ